MLFGKKFGQKAPSAKRYIKTYPEGRRMPAKRGSQKAPSAKRYIKTRISESLLVFSLGKVRKHRALKGTLRRTRTRDVSLTVTGCQ